MVFWMDSDHKVIEGSCESLASYLDNYYLNANDVRQAYLGRENQLLQTAKDLDCMQSAHAGCVATVALITPLALYNITHAIHLKDHAMIEPFPLACSILAGAFIKATDHALSIIKTRINHTIESAQMPPNP